MNGSEKTIMPNINNVLKNISIYFDKNLEINRVLDILDNTHHHYYDISENENHQENSSNKELNQLQILQTARTHKEVNSLLLELCNECRAALQPDVENNNTDNWEHFAKFVVPDQFLCFFYCLIEIGLVNPLDGIDRRLSQLAARAYILIITQPGAKAFGAFSSKLLENVLHIFKLLDTLVKANEFREHEKIEFQISCMLMLEELELFLKYVSLEENTLKKSLVEACTVVMLYYYEHNKGKCKILLSRNPPL